MNKKKLFVFVIFAVILIFTSATGTYTYFTYSQNKNEKIDTSLGNININILKDSKCSKNSGIKEALLPGKSITKKFKITNTGTLTEKLKVSLDNFKDSKDVLKYLNCKMYFNTTKDKSLVVSKKIKDLKNIKVLKKDNNSPLLLKPGQIVTVYIDIKLNKAAPYSTEKSNIKFKLIINATQSNNPNW